VLEKKPRRNGQQIRGAKDVTLPDGIAIYVATLSFFIAACSLGWQWWQWQSAKSETKKERSKIQPYFGPMLHMQEVPPLGELYIFPLYISNLGREPVIIVSVEMRYANSVFTPGAFNEPQATLGIKSDQLLPKRLDPGGTLQLEQFTLLAFQEQPMAVVVLDNEGAEYMVPDNLVREQFDRANRIREAAAEA
jgi:hypothetical protein